MGAAHWLSHAQKLAAGVLPVLMASPYSGADEMNPTPADKTAAHFSQASGIRHQYPRLRAEDRLGELLDHPAFQGFSHRILPWDSRAYDEAMPLKDIDQLLPYHTQVKPAVVVASLNRMVDDANAGRTVFYDVHTEEEKRVNPALRHTGLFFFRGRPGAPFAAIAPGGGFSYVGSVHEGFPYAEEISKRGFNAFVLKYRAGQGGRAATEDLAAAVGTSSRTPARCRWPRTATRCGAVPRVHGWLRRLARTAPPPSAVRRCRNLLSW